MIIELFYIFTGSLAIRDIDTFERKGILYSSLD
jgi:hypothetical protein